MHINVRIIVSMFIVMYVYKLCFSLSNLNLKLDKIYVYMYLCKYKKICIPSYPSKAIKKLKIDAKFLKYLETRKKEVKIVDFQLYQNK